MTPATAARLYARAFPASRRWSADEFARLMADAHVILCGDTSAMVIARIALDEAEILTLATDPDLRRQGLARTVLQSCEDRLRARHVQSVFLEVAADNMAAQALYKGFGYSLVGERPNYYRRNDGTAVAALVLRKALVVI
ncbi:MAG: ribosomal-protein-alanine acetyltransferase [Thalassobium sp.]|nr:MAG: ribosomal-protein-alanine acetyltransferase [Thalassobium sp.]QEE36665.1 GNAT family N-acetyltransferase [Octadecabacter sp. SW4]